MSEIRASEQLAAIEAASYPHMDKESQRDTVRRLTQQISSTVRPAKATAADLAQMGIEVEHVKEEVK